MGSVSVNGYRATSVCPGNSCRDSAHSCRATAGGEEAGWMETESPQGLNLHPAKQPRTTLFDWLPAGLLSLHGQPTLNRSVFLFSLSPSTSYFFSLLLPSHSLLSLCFFGIVSLPFLFFSRLLGHLARH